MSDLELGVHLGLDAVTYFEQDALGSSDFIKLHQAKEGFWWSSRHNPDRQIRTTTGQNFGSALHALLLEGPAAYEARFCIAPDKRDYIGLVDTIDQMKVAIAEVGRTPEGTSKWRAADWAAAMAYVRPDLPCWTNILEDFDAERGSKPIVTSHEDRMLRLMLRIATDPDRNDNVAVRRLFATDPDHPPLAEVSVLAEVDGLKLRWRIDKMLPRADLDLKSLANFRGRPMAWEIGEVAARHGWDIQAAHYRRGRKIALQMVRNGRLFGGTLEQRSYIRDIAEMDVETPEPTAWIWLVYAKPDEKGAAPVMCPVWDPENGDIHRYGEAKLEKAKRFYREMVKRYGLDQPWARVEPLHFTAPTGAPNGFGAGPQIMFPHWIAEDEPTEETAYAAEEQQ